MLRLEQQKNCPSTGEPVTCCSKWSDRERRCTFEGAFFQIGTSIMVNCFSGDIAGVDEMLFRHHGLFVDECFGTEPAIEVWVFQDTFGYLSPEQRRLAASYYYPRRKRFRGIIVVQLGNHDALQSLVATALNSCHGILPACAAADYDAAMHLATQMYRETPVLGDIPCGVDSLPERRVANETSGQSTGRLYRRIWHGVAVNTRNIEERVSDVDAAGLCHALIVSHSDRQQLLSQVDRQRQKIRELEIALLEQRTIVTSLKTEVRHRGRQTEQALRQTDQFQQRNVEFLSQLSHHIRTPINGIVGMSALLRDTSLTLEQKEYLGVIVNCANNTMSIITDVLNYSQIESEDFSIESVRFNFFALISDYTQRSTMRAREQGIPFVCAVDPAVNACYLGDPARIRQVLDAVTTAVMRVSDGGELTTYVETVPASEDEAVLRFVVKSASGDPQTLDLFFDKGRSAVSDAASEPFWEWHDSGFSLAMVQKLITQMGGEIGGCRLEGTGFECWFSVPLGQSQDDEYHIRETAMKGLRVLLVGDERSEIESICRLLESWELSVDLCVSVQGACDMIEDKAIIGDGYDVVLIDNSSSHINGEKLGTLILSDTRLAHPRVILLSTPGDPFGASHSRHLGFSGFLNKPFSPLDLRDCIRLVMDTENAGVFVSRHRIIQERMGSFRILVVEDNPVNRKVALGVIKKLGFRANAVSDGRQALDLLAHTGFDLVFMDVTMPEIDGLTATRMIRDGETQHLNREIPIVAMTANALKGDREECLAAGMNDYIAKPLDPKKIQRILDKLLIEPQLGIRRSILPGDLLRTTQISFFEDVRGHLSSDNDKCSN